MFPDTTGRPVSDMPDLVPACGLTCGWFIDALGDVVGDCAGGI